MNISDDQLEFWIPKRNSPKSYGGNCQLTQVKHGLVVKRQESCSVFAYGLCISPKVLVLKSTTFGIHLYLKSNEDGLLGLATSGYMMSFDGENSYIIDPKDKKVCECTNFYIPSCRWTCEDDKVNITLEVCGKKNCAE